jgi:hypothetical protein
LEDAMNDATGAGGPTDGSAAEKTQEKAQEVAGQAQEKAGEAAQKAQETIRQQVDERSTQAGERVGGTAEDLRSVGEELRKQGKDGPAKLAERAAEQTEKVGSYLQEKDSDELLHDLEDFGRRRPWAVLAGGLVLGVAAARFLKASSRDRYQQRSRPSQTSRPSTPNRSLAPAVPPTERPSGVITPGQSGAPITPGVGP